MTGAIYSTGAIGYDEFFGQVTRLFIPSLMEAAQLREGQAVLDVATGTGVAAEAALVVVGPFGSVIGGDVSPNMLEVRESGLPICQCDLNTLTPMTCRSPMAHSTP